MAAITTPTSEAGGETREAGGETREAGGETREAGGETREAGGETREAGPRARQQQILDDILGSTEGLRHHEADTFVLGGECRTEQLARLEAAEPDWWPLAELADIAPEALDPEQALSYLRVVVSHQAWLESLATRALAAAAGRVPHTTRVTPDANRESVVISDAVREEVAAALRLAPATAHQRISDARTLVQQLPATVKALESGRISGLQARVMADAVQQVTPEHADSFAQALESRVLARAMRGTVGELRSAVRSATRRIDPQGVTERARQARQSLDVQVWHDHTGVSTLSARLLTEQAVAVAAAIDGLAQSQSAPTAGQRRSEALVALVLRPEGAIDPNSGQQHDRSGPPARASLHAGVVLVMDLPTWLGLNDDPVAVLGGGDLPADVARELAADASFRRAITDPMTGRLLDYGRRTYEVPESLRRFLQMRDQVCRFPGCRRGSERCQADHALAWNDGGATSAGNLGMVCQRHHQVKTHAGWRVVESHDDGTCVWVSPQGRRYVVDPPVLIEPEPAESQSADS